MALQVLGQLKSKWPTLSFSFLVSDECQSLVLDSPLIDRVFSLPRRALKSLAELGKLQEAVDALTDFVQDLSSTHFDLSLNFFQEDFGGVLQSLVVADRKMGLELGERGQFKLESRFMQHLASIPAAREKNGWHVVDLYIRAASEDISALMGTPTPPCSPNPTRTRTLANILPKRKRPNLAQDLDKNGYLIFHPGSAWEGKRWPENHWAQLANLCLVQGMTVVFTGSKEEMPLLSRIKDQMNLNSADSGSSKFLIDAVGRTTLLEATWLIENAKQVLTGDTVAMHLAAAMRTPTLALFGPSNPVETGPYGPGHVIFQIYPLPRPNLAFECPHPGLVDFAPEILARFIFPDSSSPSKLASTSITPEFKIWQTEWSGDLEMQVLSDTHRKRHPSFYHSQPLRQILDARGMHGEIKGRKVEASQHLLDPLALSDPRKTLLGALSQAREMPNPNSLLVLEQSEQALAEQTQDSLIWESYRIAINGIELQNLAEYLAHRQNRLLLALAEEKETKAASPP